MNWVTVAVVGAVAVWFEYSYRRSRHKKAEPDGDAVRDPETSVTQHAQVASPGNEPSIVPGDENDKKMNATV